MSFFHAISNDKVCFLFPFHPLPFKQFPLYLFFSPSLALLEILMNFFFSFLDEIRKKCLFNHRSFDSCVGNIENLFETLRMHFILMLVIPFYSFSLSVSLLLRFDDLIASNEIVLIFLKEFTALTNDFKWNRDIETVDKSAHKWQNPFFFLSISFSHSAHFHLPSSPQIFM